MDKRKKVEEAPRENYKRYRELADSIGDVFFAMNKDLKYTYWNKASEKLTGIKARDAVGKSIFEIFPDREDTRRAIAAYRKVLKTQRPQSFLSEYNLRGKDYFFEISAYPLKDGVSVFVRDVTERKKMESDVRESREKFRSLFMGNPEASVHLDLDDHIVDVNPRFAELFEYSLDEVKGKHINDVVVPEDKMEEAEMLDKKGKKGYAHHETVRRRKNGTLVPVSISTAPITIENKVIGSIVLYKDITEQKWAEQMLMERVKELICLFSIDVLTAQPEVKLDSILREAVNIIPPSLQYPEVACARVTYGKQGFETGNFKETEWKLSADINVGEERAGAVEVYYLEEKPERDEGPFLKEEGTLLNAVANRLGITIERIQAREKLLKSEKNYRSLFESVFEGVFQTTPDGSVSDFLIIPETSGLLVVILFSIIMIPTMGLLKGQIWFKTSWLLLGIAIGLGWGITRMTLIITTAYLFGSNTSSFLYYVLIFFDIPWVVMMWSTGVSFLKREKLEEKI